MTTPTLLSTLREIYSEPEQSRALLRYACCSRPGQEGILGELDSATDQRIQELWESVTPLERQGELQLNGNLLAHLNGRMKLFRGASFGALLKTIPYLRPNRSVRRSPLIDELLLSVFTEAQARRLRARRNPRETARRVLRMVDLTKYRPRGFTTSDKVLETLSEESRLREAAKEDKAEAMVQLCLNLGQKSEEAQVWLDKAVELDHPPALHLKAEQYLEEGDVDLAVEFFYLATRQGHLPSLETLTKISLEDGAHHARAVTYLGLLEDVYYEAYEQRLDKASMMYHYAIGQSQDPLACYRLALLLLYPPAALPSEVCETYNPYALLAAAASKQASFHLLYLAGKGIEDAFQPLSYLFENGFGGFEKNEEFARIALSGPPILFDDLLSKQMQCYFEQAIRHMAVEDISIFIGPLKRLNGCHGDFRDCYGDFLVGLLLLDHSELTNNPIAALSAVAHFEFVKSQGLHTPDF